MHTDLYNWNVFENSAYCPNFETAVKYSEMYLDSGNQEYRLKAFYTAAESILSEYSSLTKENQLELLTIYNLVKTAE